MIETKSYSGELVLRDPTRLLISISSFGYAPNERYHQFWKYAEATGASALFLADKSLRWYNCPETEEVFMQIARVARDFEHVSIIGDSMGGSGAILLSNYVSNASRVLTFAPQFSMALPFIEFDERYRKRAAEIEYLYFDNYGHKRTDCAYFLLYGDTVWQDQLHRAMFEAFGFKTITVPGAPHPIPRFIQNKSRDVLSALINALCDFTAAFDDERIAKILAPLGLEDLGFRRRHVGGDPLLGRSAMASKRIAKNPAVHEISLNKPSTQSSIGSYSVGTSVTEDASRGNSGEIWTPYAFHTANEEDPWWAVDLQGAHILSHVAIYNRIDNLRVRARADQLAIEIKATADSAWEPVYLKLTRQAIDDGEGKPFVWIADREIVATQLRIRLIGKKSLHLRKVSVFGQQAKA